MQGQSKSRRQFNVGDVFVWKPGDPSREDILLIIAVSDDGIIKTISTRSHTPQRITVHDDIESTIGVIDRGLMLHLSTRR